MSYQIQQVVVFDRRTGRVLSSGTTQAPERLVSDSQDVLIGFSASPNESYVQNGAILSVPRKPSDIHTFNWSSKQWEDLRTPASEWPLVRAKRDKLISDSDWVVTKATETGQPVPAAWSAYRQALRDITLQADPLNLVWPVAP